MYCDFFVTHKINYDNSFKDISKAAKILIEVWSLFHKTVYGLSGNIYSEKTIKPF
jgi:hypothetical protein